MSRWNERCLSRTNRRRVSQATTRSINALFSLRSYLPFDQLPTWRTLRALPLEEQKRRLADPVLRAQLVAEEAGMKPRDKVFQGGGLATTEPEDLVSSFSGQPAVEDPDGAVGQISNNGVGGL